MSMPPNYDEDLSREPVNSPACTCPNLAGDCDGTHDNEQGKCTHCHHDISEHILHGRFGPDECEGGENGEDCECRYYEPVIPPPNFYNADKRPL